jgi:Ca-activated chloride channel family protein
MLEKEEFKDDFKDESRSDKPECGLCHTEDGLSEEMVSNLLYSFFNPYSKTDRKIKVEEYIKNHLKDEETIQNFEKLDSIFRELITNFGYSDSSWVDKLDEFREAREKAWNQIKEELQSGIITEEDLSPNDLIENLGEEIVEELIKEGYIQGYERRRYRRIITFSEEAERLIGEKVLNLALENLPVRCPGLEETSKRGISIFSGHKITEYDPNTHVFDNIDLSETLVKCAMSGDMSFDEKNIVAREPKHMEKVLYVMLIDVSDSMRGKKFIGAIEAAIGLREAIKKRESRELSVVAFNHRAREIRRGEILNLFPQGRTDIGLALRKAREIILKKDATGLVFLITDGEPTSSYNPFLSPGMCAIKEAKMLGGVDARLSIIMLGKDDSFRKICERMAEACGSSRIFYFSNPLDLKNYFVREYGIRG